MKKTNKSISFVLLISMVMLMFMVFAGCSARSPITADTFKKDAQSISYTVSNGSNYSDAESDLVATNAKTGGKLEYISMPDGNSAQKIYYSLKDSVSVGSSKPTIVDSSSYNKYIISNGDIYTVLVRMDKTVIFGQTNMSDKATLDQFISTIKY